MKLAIVCSKTFDDYEYLKNILQWHIISCTQMLGGGAKNSINLVKRYAVERGILFKEFATNWDQIGNSAGYAKDQQIANTCNELVAFWDKKSQDTKHVVDLVDKTGKPVYIYWPPKKDNSIIDGIGA